MSNRLDLRLGEPDALSQLLEGLELRAEVYISGEFCGSWAVDSSGHRQMTFHLISSGEAWVHMHGREPVRMGPGDLVLFPHDAKHVMSDSEKVPEVESINRLPDYSPALPKTNMTCGYLDFENPMAWPVLETLDEMILLDTRARSCAPNLRRYLDLVVAELEERRGGFRAVLRQLANLIFVEILRQQIAVGKVESGILAALFHPKISRSLAAIHGRANEPWSLESLAAEAHTGRSSFAKLFNELTGMPAMTYLLRWRMQLARHWLATTSWSISDIAERSGYETDAAFRKAFKKIHGITPGEARGPK